jgi:hypothetical protein
VNAAALFSVYCAAAILLVATEIYAPCPRRSVYHPKPLSAAPYVVLLVAAYAFQLFLIRYGATNQTDWAPWRSNLPLPVITRTAYHADAIAIAVVALTAIESWALFAIYRRRITRGLLVACAATLLLLSIAEPALISPDTYSYVADAALGSAAYAPPAIPFSGDYRVINDALGAPLPASPYGPLWIWIAQVATVAFPILLAKLLAFRAIGVLALAAFVAALVRLRLPMRVVALAALNPGLMLQYVTNAHNEIVCMACIAWAAVAIRKAPAVSATLVIAAAAIKFPFAALGAPIFVRVPSIWARTAWMAAVLGISAAFAWFVGGAGYVAALTHHLPGGGVDILGLCVAAIALGLLVAALYERRRLNSAVWCFPLMASYPTPWYVGWGAGYALGSRRTLAYLLVWFPFCSALVDTMFMQLWTLEIVVPVVTVASVLWMLDIRPGAAR